MHDIYIGSVCEILLLGHGNVKIRIISAQDSAEFTFGLDMMHYEPDGATFVIHPVGDIYNYRFVWMAQNWVYARKVLMKEDEDET